MAQFNTKQSKVKLTNLAGGAAYAERKELALAALLLTSFGSDKFYANRAAIFKKLEALLEITDKKFAANAILFARKEYGMRSITHYAASYLAQLIRKEPWARQFFRDIIHRPDDMTEIFACHKARNQKLSNAMKKGFADALTTFAPYQLAKYRGEGHGTKLVDIVNLCHPKESECNNGAISKLIRGELKSFDTWESAISAAGSDKAKKTEAWRKLLAEKKLGYMALLRNIRNIVALDNAEIKDMALKQLMNKDAIRKSLLLPFRFVTAYDELKKVDAQAALAIGRAAQIACSNIPTLSGKTLIALDVSGSMRDVAPTATMFAAALMKSGNDCDLITFADEAEYKFVNPDDSLMTIREHIAPNICGGTNFHAIFNTANKSYDRIILLSDMQAWQLDPWHLNRTPSAAFNMYKARYNANCTVFSFDLAGYGTLQVPERDVCCLAGFSEKIFDLIPYLETNANVLLDTIRDYAIK